jgi:hypothetical protein
VFLFGQQPELVAVHRAALVERAQNEQADG